jgi:low affinity Fe/Cu permease
MGLDCESRAIFGVNAFGPLGIMLFVCAIGSLKRKSSTTQIFLALGIAAVMSFWVSQVAIHG